MSNTELIQKFYQSFANADAEGMVSCYAADIVFTDPAFGTLHGEDAKNMWRMLIVRSKGDLKITFGKVQADERSGSAEWVAEYVFSQTGRKVVNKIAARFEFLDEKIVKHTDHFNMWRWTQQALGLPGYLLGWTSFLEGKVRKQALASLKAYTKK